MNSVMAAHRHLAMHVLQHRAEVAEPDITPVSRAEEGVRSFLVDDDCLCDAHLAPNTGPWLVKAVVLLVMTTISADADIPLPSPPTVPPEGGHA